MKKNLFDSDEDDIIKNEHLENRGAPDGLATGGREIVPYGIHASNESSSNFGGPAFLGAGGAIGCFH